VCRDPATGRRVSERSTTVSFYVVHHADDVNVYVVDQSGTTVRTIARGVSMHKSKAPTPRAFRAVTKYFSWNGRNDAGRVVVPGTYFFRVYLVHQQRTIELPQSVRVESTTHCV
jgi:flagellar hook assembly protein FlgD